MKNFGSAVVKVRHLILILAFVLLVPAVWGYTHTRVNYDILTYLPDSIETIKGQDILMNEFGTGAITMLIVEDKNDKEIVALKQEIEKVEHVKKVLWYDSFADITIPKEMLPDKIRRGDADPQGAGQRMLSAGYVRGHHRYKGPGGVGGADLCGAGSSAVIHHTGAEHGHFPGACVFPSLDRYRDHL